MEVYKNSFKEKIKNVVSRCRNTCEALYLKSKPLLQKVMDNKRKVVMTITAAVIIIGIGTASLYLLNLWKYRNESPTFSSIRKSDLAGTSEVGSKFIMGDLEITLQNVVEGSYRPLELDQNGVRITKNYLSAQIMIFNIGYTEKDFLVFGLEDENGGQYERDTEVEFYVKELKDMKI